MAAEKEEFSPAAGTLVWGALGKNWWPGRVAWPDKAPPKVKEAAKADTLLVHWFDDWPDVAKAPTKWAYGWLPPAKIKPFEASFNEMSKKSKSKVFVDAVNQAILLLKTFQPEGWTAHLELADTDAQKKLQNQKVKDPSKPKKVPAAKSFEKRSKEPMDPAYMTERQQLKLLGVNVDGEPSSEEESDGEEDGGDDKEGDGGEKKEGDAGVGGGEEAAANLTAEVKEEGGKGRGKGKGGRNKKTEQEEEEEKEKESARSESDKEKKEGEEDGQSEKKSAKSEGDKVEKKEKKGEKQGEKEKKVRRQKMVAQVKESSGKKKKEAAELSTAFNIPEPDLGLIDSSSDSDDESSRKAEKIEEEKKSEIMTRNYFDEPVEQPLKPYDKIKTTVVEDVDDDVMIVDEEKPAKKAKVSKKNSEGKHTSQLPAAPKSEEVSKRPREQSPPHVPDAKDTHMDPKKRRLAEWTAGVHDSKVAAQKVDSSKCRLFLGNLPVATTPEKLTIFLNSINLGDCVKEVRVPPGKRFGFIALDTLESTVRARGIIADNKMEDHQIKVEYAGGRDSDRGGSDRWGWSRDDRGAMREERPRERSRERERDFRDGGRYYDERRHDDRGRSLPFPLQDPRLAPPPDPRLAQGDPRFSNMQTALSGSLAPAEPRARDPRLASDPKLGQDPRLASDPKPGQDPRLADPVGGLLDPRMLQLGPPQPPQPVEQAPSATDVAGLLDLLMTPGVVQDLMRDTVPLSGGPPLDVAGANSQSRLLTGPAGLAQGGYAHTHAPLPMLGPEGKIMQQRAVQDAFAATRALQPPPCPPPGWDVERDKHAHQRFPPLPPGRERERGWGGGFEERRDGTREYDHERRGRHRDERDDMGGRGQGGGDRGKGRRSGRGAAMSNETVIPVPSDKMGIIIGKKGVMVNTLKREAESLGLRLDVVTVKDGPDGDGEVHISGSDDESIMNLRIKIIDLMRSEVPPRKFEGGGGRRR